MGRKAVGFMINNHGIKRVEPNDESIKEAPLC